MNTAFKIIMAAIYFWLFSITFGGIVAHGYTVPDSFLGFCANCKATCPDG